MTDIKAPWHLWLIGVIAVLFNSIGVFDFVMSMAQGANYMASAGMTPEQIAHYQKMPIWMTGVWAIGVWGAFLASILLLLRRKLAFARENGRRYSSATFPQRSNDLAFSREPRRHAASVCVSLSRGSSAAAAW